MKQAGRVGVLAAFAALLMTGCGSIGEDLQKILKAEGEVAIETIVLQATSQAAEQITTQIENALQQQLTPGSMPSS